MDEPILGYIALVGFNFAPLNWAFCNGQLLPIAQFTALFSLLGTTYGGDGQTTFALPDLRGRVPLHFGQGPGLSDYSLGQRAGSESVTLVTNQMPAHTHVPQCASAQGNSAAPTGAVWAATAGDKLYSTVTPGAAMAPAAIGQAGTGLPHENRQPFLGLNFIIALDGLFPTQS